jgi:murein tripeptide amidase MpaA
VAAEVHRHECLSRYNFGEEKSVCQWVQAAMRTSDAGLAGFDQNIGLCWFVRVTNRT